MNYLKNRYSIVEFHSMDELPDIATDNNRNEEPFSVPVLAYDAGLDVWTIAWYNYDTEDWMDHSDDSLEFSFWCYLPHLNNFIECNPDLPKVRNAGYVESMNEIKVEHLVDQLRKYFYKASRNDKSGI